MIFRFIATGIGGFVYPFTQVHIMVEDRLRFPLLTELAHLLGAADRGACHGVDGGHHWQDHDRRRQG